MAVILENTVIRSQIVGEWPMYIHSKTGVPVCVDEAENPCTLLPPGAVLHMIYVSSEGQCYVVERHAKTMQCSFRLLRSDYWLNPTTPRNSLFCAIEFQRSVQKTVLGLFDVLILDKKTLAHLPVFDRVQKLHDLLTRCGYMGVDTNICFHFVGQQDCVLRHLSDNSADLHEHSAVQLRKRDGSFIFELVPLKFE